MCNGLNVLKKKSFKCIEFSLYNAQFEVFIEGYLVFRHLCCKGIIAISKIIGQGCFKDA